MNLIPGAFEMGVDNLRKRGKEFFDRFRVAGCNEVLTDRFKEPQRGVNRVVLRCSARIRKIVRQHSSVNVTGKGKKYRSCDVRTARRDEETWQCDHGVAAPIAKPVIASDDRAGVRIAGQRALHNELIGVQHQLLNPTRSGRSQKLVRFVPVREYRVLQLVACREARYSIELNAWNR